MRDSDGVWEKGKRALSCNLHFDVYTQMGSARKTTFVRTLVVELIGLRLFVAWTAICIFTLVSFNDLSPRRLHCSPITIHRFQNPLYFCPQ